MDNGLETSQHAADAHERQHPIEIRDGKWPFIESYGIIRTYLRIQLIHVMENERINTVGGCETQVLCKCKTIEYGNAVVRWAFKQLACCLLLGLIVLLNI